MVPTSAVAKTHHCPLHPFYPPCGPAVAVVSQVSLATEAQTGSNILASAAARDFSWQSDSTKVNREPMRLFYLMYFVVMSTKTL